MHPRKVALEIIFNYLGFFFSTMAKPKNTVQLAKERLQSAKFRIINELLYTSSSQKASEYFSKNKMDFTKYHEGWKFQQSKGWPITPSVYLAELIVKRYPESTCVVDMGCGEAILHKTLLTCTTKTFKVYSFDLVSCDPIIVTACDTSKVPLASNNANVIVFSLSLMNVNYYESLYEASRISMINARLFIVEVESRFTESISKEFIGCISCLGFKIVDVSHKRIPMFIYFEFEKTTPVDLKKLPFLNWPKLKPCIYKRR